MNQIILHGGLRDKFGESFNVDVRDPAEAFRALASQLEGFREMIRKDEFWLVREMPNGNFAIDEDMLFVGMHNTKIHLIPSIEGANKKKGGIKLVIGIALIGASLFIPGSTMLIGTLAAQTFGILTGAAIALGGLSLLLTPTPKLNTGEQDNKDSALYSGTLAATGQNLAVPVGFGTFRVKGIPIATQIVTNQFSSGDYEGGSGEKFDGGGGGHYNPDMVEV